MSSLPVGESRLGGTRQQDLKVRLSSLWQHMQPAQPLLPTCMMVRGGGLSLGCLKMKGEGLSLSACEVSLRTVSLCCAELCVCVCV